jgi:putative membrane protein
VDVVTLRWTDWNADPTVTAGLVVVALVYIRLSRRFPARGHQPVYFWLGWLVLAVALLSPIDLGAKYLFTLHMLQHMLLLLVAPPLIALAVPPSLLGWIYQRPLLRRWLRAVWSPVPAFLLFNGTLLLWHLPGAYDATLRSPWVHAAEHASFIAAGLVFWGLIASPAPVFVRASWGLRLGLLVGADIVNFILGFALTFAGRPLYPTYTTVPRLWGLSPLSDLKLGGVLMWVMGQMMYAAPVLILINIILWRDGSRGAAHRPRPEVPSPVR